MKPQSLVILGLLILAGNLGFAADKEVLVPEADVRKLLGLPADGHVYSHVLRQNVWPKNKTAYERNEMVEIAFGRGLRSKQKDRKKEKAMPPGIRFAAGTLALQGGWRVHKEVKKHPDHFDGTFRGNLRLAVNRGGVVVAVENLDLKWRRSFLAQLGGALLPVDVVGALETSMEQRVKRELESSIKKAAQKELAAYAGAPLHLISARIVPAGLMLTLHAQAGD